MNTLKTLSLAMLLAALPASAATITVAWTNGDNPTATTNWTTVVSWGVSPGVYTNSISIPYGATQLTISNLVSGVRYYLAAQHCDQTTDCSIFSNEANVKTKPNPPKTFTGQTP